MRTVRILAVPAPVPASGGGRFKRLSRRRLATARQPQRGRKKVGMSLRGPGLIPVGHERDRPAHERTTVFSKSLSSPRAGSLHGTGTFFATEARRTLRA